MNPSTALARVLVDELRRCGVTEAVLAPGSRSAPLALALAQEPGIRLHVRIDERSAGFLAIGLARASGNPAAVVCTSGTAVANLHPAVLEAHEGNVPLLLLTADRPPELRGTGSSQTVDQVGLFGRSVRLFADVGVPESVPGQVAYWRSLVGRAVAAASDGPVHLNLPLREPLVPDGDPTWPEPLDGRADGLPWVRVGSAPPAVGAEFADLFDGPVPERGVVIAGDRVADPLAVVEFAAALGWPLLAEPTSGARRDGAIAGYPFLLADAGFAAETPDCVVVVGNPGLSRALLRWAAKAPRHVVVDPSPRWADPTRRADLVLPTLPTVSVPLPSGAWLQRWQEAAAVVEKVLDDLIGADPLTELAVARTVGTAAARDGLVFVGPSRPIRDLEATFPDRPDVRVLANRGVNGIDGVVSAAIGAALADQSVGGGPAVALLGDLTYLHDRNGLLLGPEDPRPNLTLVVVDNDGGGIFSTLPQAGSPGFERVFATPHGRDLCADAAFAGVPAITVSTHADLVEALFPEPGLRLVRVATDRAANAALLLRVQHEIGAALHR
ncbi:MAG: 2-succinyl-5-enolpyruvyl-6-hydroxy-3-cyclohexene-1-carboxylic-acid synthase [Sporichthyaceae bacterium]